MISVERSTDAVNEKMVLSGARLRNVARARV